MADLAQIATAIGIAVTAGATWLTNRKAASLAPAVAEAGEAQGLAIARVEGQVSAIASAVGDLRRAQVELTAGQARLEARLEREEARRRHDDEPTRPDHGRPRLRSQPR